MKKVLLFVGALVCASTFAQDCSKIFISEYVEGFENNKALEIYNPTPNPVNLSEYFVGRLNNGTPITSLTANMCVQLTGTLAPYSTHVGVLDKRNPAGTGTELPIWYGLEIKADAFYTPIYATSFAFYWNGNDCIVLAKGSASNPQAVTTEIVDFFGKSGQDPFNSAAGTNGWSSVAPFNMTSGSPLDRVVTEDKTLIRKATVLKGKQNPTETFAPTYVFNPLLEYDSIRPNIPGVPALYANGDTMFFSDGVTAKWAGNWGTLGWHNCNCAPDASIEEATIQSATIYPNPTNGTFYVKGAEAISAVEVYNGLGQKVKTINAKSNQIIAVDLDAKQGLYIVKLSDNKGNSVTKRVIVK